MEQNHNLSAIHCAYIGQLYVTLWQIVYKVYILYNFTAFHLAQDLYFLYENL